MDRPSERPVVLIADDNQQNVEQWAYDYRGRTRAPVSLLPIYPVLGVKGAF